VSPGKRKTPDGAGADAETRPSQPPTQYLETASALDHVRRVLDAPGDPGLPRALQEVQAVRSAARFVAHEAELPIEDRALALVGLLAVVKATEIPWLAAQAVLAELVPEDEPPLPPDRWEVTQRRLRRVGYSECPLCQAAIARDAELERYDRMRRWAAEDAARREGAVAS
jgi:hypothetical protein